jgi:hypothetical protein
MEMERVREKEVWGALKTKEILILSVRQPGLHRKTVSKKQRKEGRK